MSAMNLLLDSVAGLALQEILLIKHEDTHKKIYIHIGWIRISLYEIIGINQDFMGSTWCFFRKETTFPPKVDTSSPLIKKVSNPESIVASSSRRETLKGFFYPYKSLQDGPKKPRFFL